MSIDRYYTRIDGQWVSTNMHVTNKDWEHIGTDQQPDFGMDFWVDLCHGSGSLTDERYFFANLASAIDFYLHGWKDRQYVDSDDQLLGIDCSGLYWRGRLIHRMSITATHLATMAKSCARCASRLRGRSARRGWMNERRLLIIGATHGEGSDGARGSGCGTGHFYGGPPAFWLEEQAGANDLVCD